MCTYTICNLTNELVNTNVVGEFYNVRQASSVALGDLGEIWDFMNLNNSSWQNSISKKKQNTNL